jgi:hypothetical protein
MSHELPIRLAIRHEGNSVNAYLAFRGTMKGATFIGSLAIGIASRSDFFERWKNLMSDALALAVEDISGEAPEMSIKPAPEHERGGNA